MKGKFYIASTCVGQYSIQREINNIARWEHPKFWKTMIVDAEWREKMRQELRDRTEQWCDHRESTCYCEIEDNPKASREIAAIANTLF